MKRALTQEETRRIAEISVVLGLEFQQWVRTWTVFAEGPKIVLECLHPCNRDEWLRGFGHYLEEKKIEFASND